MSKKTNAFAKKPRNENKPAIRNADDWIKDRGDTKRLTLDIPASLHTHIKSECARRGVKMIDEILPLLQNYFSLNDEK